MTGVVRAAHISYNKATSGSPIGNPDVLPFETLGGLQCVYMQLHGAFQIRSLVLVHDVVLCELVQHRSHFRKQCFGSALLGGCTQGFHRIARRLVEQTVVRTLGQGLTNSFFR